METETLIGAIAVFSTILGAWIGGSISSRATFRIAKLQAHSRLIYAFSEELTILKTSTDTTPGSTYGILNASFSKHLTAYIELSSILSNKDSLVLNKKWNAYSQENSSFHPIEREKYRFSYLLKDDISEPDRRILAVKHIEALIQFR